MIACARWQRTVTPSEQALSDLPTILCVVSAALLPLQPPHSNVYPSSPCPILFCPTVALVCSFPFSQAVCGGLCCAPRGQLRPGLSAAQQPAAAPRPAALCRGLADAPAELHDLQQLWRVLQGRQGVCVSFSGSPKGLMTQIDCAGWHFGCRRFACNLHGWPRCVLAAHVLSFHGFLTVLHAVVSHQLMFTTTTAAVCLSHVMQGPQAPCPTCASDFCPTLYCQSCLRERRPCSLGNEPVPMVSF